MNPKDSFHASNVEVFDFPRFFFDGYKAVYECIDPSIMEVACLNCSPTVPQGCDILSKCESI